MADVHINLYAMLGLVEALFVALLLTAVLFLRLRGARRRVAEMQEQLRDAETAMHQAPQSPAAPPPPPEPAAPPRDYADFLRDELAQSDFLLGDDRQPEAAGAGDSAGTDEAELLRQMLAVRYQFLQLELDVQGVKSTADAEAQRRSIAMGMQALLDGLRTAPAAPAASPPADDVDVDIGTDTAHDTTPDSEDVPTVPREVRCLEDQIAHLRTIIDNQHSVMRELRQLLEEHAADSEELQEALRKLGDAEAQALELQRCLEVMDHENERLRAAPRRDLTTPAGSPDADMLRDLVGSQQRTISKLQHMLQSLAPDSGKAKELGDAIGKIQRANSELNSCVMVLEDENAMLRGQVETLQERLADLEVQAEPQDSMPPVSMEKADGISAVATEMDAAAVISDPGMEAGPSEPAAVAADDEQPQLDTDELLAELFGGKDPSTADKPH